jgi:hypothetical protein
MDVQMAVTVPMIATAMSASVHVRLFVYVPL